MMQDAWCGGIVSEWSWWSFDLIPPTTYLVPRLPQKFDGQHWSIYSRPLLLVLSVFKGGRLVKIPKFLLQCQHETCLSEVGIIGCYLLWVRIWTNGCHHLVTYYCQCRALPNLYAIIFLNPLAFIHYGHEISGHLIPRLQAPIWRCTEMYNVLLSARNTNSYPVTGKAWFFFSIWMKSTIQTKKALIIWDIYSLHYAAAQDSYKFWAQVLALPALSPWSSGPQCSKSRFFPAAQRLILLD